MEKILKKLLPSKLLEAIKNCSDFASLNEIRLRANKPLQILVNGKFEIVKAVATDLKNDNFFNNDDNFGYGENVIISQKDIDAVLTIASGSSIYAVNENLIKGYLSFDGGIRIGVLGEGVLENNKATTLKNISYLCIRIPHQVFMDFKTTHELIENVDSTLIVSPTAGGKTTFLRELTRQVSNGGKNCLIIDERGELSAIQNGVPFLDVGICSDIATNLPKAIVYENMIRCMNPEIIVTDEIFGESEVESILDISRCGIKVFATIHSNSLDKIKNSKIYSKLLDVFKYIVFLDKNQLGRIKNFYINQKE